MLRPWRPASTIVERWSQRDVELRSRLIFNSIRDQVSSGLGSVRDSLLVPLFERIAEDERVLASNQAIHTAISRVRFDQDYWQPARRQDGDEREGAAVAEWCTPVDLSDWPEGTRLIVRREPLHPGAQQSLFPSTMFRYWGHYTDAAGDPVALDVHMRAHAHVEDHIRRLKDSGATRFPFVDIDANRAWLAIVCFADALVRWFQLLCLTGAARRRRTQDAALGPVARPRPARAPRPTKHRAHPRRLAHHHRCSTPTSASPSSPEAPSPRAKRHHPRRSRRETAQNRLPET